MGPMQADWIGVGMRIAMACSESTSQRSTPKAAKLMSGREKEKERERERERKRGCMCACVSESEGVWAYIIGGMKGMCASARVNFWAWRAYRYPHSPSPGHNHNFTF